MLRLPSFAPRPGQLRAATKSWTDRLARIEWWLLEVMAPMTRSFPSPHRNEGSKAKANCGAGDERRHQMQGLDAVHGSGISACLISLNNP